MTDFPDKPKTDDQVFVSEVIEEVLCLVQNELIDEQLKKAGVSREQYEQVWQDPLIIRLFDYGKQHYDPQSSQFLALKQSLQKLATKLAKAKGMDDKTVEVIKDFVPPQYRLVEKENASSHITQEKAAEIKENILKNAPPEILKTIKSWGQFGNLPVVGPLVGEALDSAITDVTVNGLFKNPLLTQMRNHADPADQKPMANNTPDEDIKFENGFMQKLDDLMRNEQINRNLLEVGVSQRQYNQVWHDPSIARIFEDGVKHLDLKAPLGLDDPRFNEVEKAMQAQAAKIAKEIGFRNKAVEAIRLAIPKGYRADRYDERGVNVHSAERATEVRKNIINHVSPEIVEEARLWGYFKKGLLGSVIEEAIEKETMDSGATEHFLIDMLKQFKPAVTDPVANAVPVNGVIGFLADKLLVAMHDVGLRQDGMPPMPAGKTPIAQDRGKQNGKADL